jgi:hypothetical protein
MLPGSRRKCAVRPSGTSIRRVRARRPTRICRGRGASSRRVGFPPHKPTALKPSVRQRGLGRYRALVCIVLVLAAVAGVIAPEGVSGHDPAPRAAFAAVQLHPLNRQARVQCRLAKELAICPARLFREPPSLSAAPHHRRCTQRYRPSRSGKGVMVGMAFSYGLQGSREAAAGVTTCVEIAPVAFLHFEIWRALRGIPPFPDGAHRARLAGRVGDLAPATGFGLACEPVTPVSGSATTRG